MAEGPIESWEDLELENEALAARLDKIKFDGSNARLKRPDGLPSISEGSKLINSNCNGNGIKILKRPTAAVVIAAATTNSQASSSTATTINPLVSHVNPLIVATSKNQAYISDGYEDFPALGSLEPSTINPNTSGPMTFSTLKQASNKTAKGKGFTNDTFNYNNSSEPLFAAPNHKMPQITLEDSTRTQYVPKVKILQRPKGPPIGTKNGQDGENKSPSKSNATGNNLLTKSYQEREAEYAKVRLRILGSAVPDYKESDLVSPTLPSNVSSPTAGRPNGDSNSHASGSKPNDVPVVRLPQGPDGTKGFSSRR